MAAKKYLSLDEVKDQLGMTVEQINKLREGGRLRGFADRGTWKFKSDDVEEFARSRQADSSPDMPLMDLDDDSASVFEEDAVGEQATVIRGGSGMGGSALYDDDEPLLSTSDSDVRLIPDDSYTVSPTASRRRPGRDSDSDVRLVDEDARPAAPRSDSDVKLISDSDTREDVRLLSDDAVPVFGGSDSDVALVAPGGSALDDDDDFRPLAGDSGIALESNIADSGIALDAGFGSSLGQTDSGIALEALSGPSLGGSSVLLGGGDSGISLDVGESGISLAADSGISLGGSDILGQTVPMMDVPGRGADSADTRYEMPADDDGSEFELAAFGGSDSSEGNDTSVILFDDEDAIEESAPTFVQKKAAPNLQKKPAAKADAFDDEFDVGEGSSEFEVAAADEEFGSFDDDGDAVEVSEDDEDLTFEAADDDFEEGFEAGESQADFLPATQQVVAAPEPEFGAPTFAGLAITSIILSLCGMMMFDLVRSMWSLDGNGPMLSGMLLDSMKGMF